MSTVQRFSAEEVQKRQFNYFTWDFKKEHFAVQSLAIDGSQLSANVNVSSFDGFNISLLLLDRLSQSLGFFIIQHIREQQKRPVRFIFIKHMQWNFSGPLRPSKPLLIEATHCLNQEERKKDICRIDGNISNKAFFSYSIDVFNI